MASRTVRQQLLAGILVCWSVLIASFPVYSRNKDNPDKIGHRSVARDTSISPKKEAEIGRQAAERFESSIDLIRDPVVEQYVAKLAASVVSHSDWKDPLPIKVIRSPQVNASSLAGGHIYLSRALLVEA